MESFIGDEDIYPISSLRIGQETGYIGGIVMAYSYTGLI